MSATVVVSVKVIKRAQKKREDLDKAFQEWRLYNLSKLYSKTKKWKWKKESFIDWFCYHTRGISSPPLFKEEDFPEEYRKYWSPMPRDGLKNPPEVITIHNAQWVRNGLVEISVSEYNTLTRLLELPIIHPPEYAVDPYSLAFMWEGKEMVKKGPRSSVYWLDGDVLIFSQKIPNLVIHKGKWWKYNRRQIKTFKKLMEKEANES